MTPTPEPDVVVDIAAAVHRPVARPLAAHDTFSWDLDGDVLRDLLSRAG